MLLALLPIRPSEGQAPEPGGSYYCQCTTNRGGENATGGDPVDLQYGAQLWAQTDMAIGGPIPMQARRHHVTLNYGAGPFGPGTSMDYDWFVTAPSWDTLNSRLVVGPGNVSALFDTYHTAAGLPYYWTSSSEPQWAGCRLIEDAGGAVRTLRFPNGAEWQFGVNGCLLATRDRLGHGLNFSRNQSGYLTSIGNTMDARTISINYNAEGVVGSITNGFQTVQYSYDSNLCLQSITDAASGVTAYSWQEIPSRINFYYLLTSVVDPRGVTILQNSHDLDGRVVSQQLGNGGIYQFQYVPTPDGTTTTVTDPNGNATVYEMFGASSTMGSRLKSVTNALGRKTQFTYSSTGPIFLTGVTDFRGRTVSFNRDPNTGNLLSVTRPTVSGGTAVTSMTYDSTWNELASSVNELGQTTAVTRDSQGLPIAVTSPWSSTVQMSWNTAGQISALTPAWGGNPFTTTYRADGRPISATNPLGETVSVGYDNQDRPQQFTDALLRSVTRSYAPSGRLSSVTGPEGRGYGLTRGAANLLTGLTVSGGNATHQWGYNGAAVATSSTDPAGAVASMTRDGNGNPLVLMRRTGEKVEATYGPMDRLAQVLYRKADGTVESTVTYSYDPATDLLSSIVDSVGPDYSFSYNSLDQVIAISGPEGVTSVTRDDLGRVTQVQAPGQTAIQYGRDSFGRLTSITKGPAVVQFGYDSAGRRSSITLPNGIVKQYLFDALSRVRRIEHRLSGNLIEYEEYTRDAGGRVTQRDRNGVISTFGHSLHNELTSYGIPGQTGSFGYSAASNRTSQTVNGLSETLTYNTANRILTDGAASVTHNANGQATQYGSASLTWNVRGELVQVVDGGVTTQFQHDCFGRRVLKSVNGVVTRYVYLGHDLAAEADASWNQTAEYFYLPGVDRPVSRTDGAGTVYYLTDHAGTVTALARPDGTLYGRYFWNPWGELVSADAGMPSQPLGWTAREYDGTGLYYLRGRYYHPGTGRFLSEDPIGLAGGLNLYSFAGNSPLGARDPFGLDADWLDYSTDFFSGMGSALTYGATDYIQDMMGTDDQVDRGSGMYFLGGIAGDFVGDAIAPGLGRMDDLADAGRGLGRGGGLGPGIMPGGGGGGPGPGMMPSGPGRGGGRPRQGSLPMEGAPGGSGAIDNGSGKGQIRDYGPDGYPDVDFDFGHDHNGAGDPHAHDWGRPPGGGRPTHEDRGRARPITDED